MAASRLSSCIALTATAAAASTLSNRAYADSPFRFPSFRSPSPPPSTSQSDPSSQSTSSSDGKNQTKPEPEEPRGSGFDPESLERGAKALREINNSPHAKQVSV